MTEKIELPQFQCKRCEHKWYPKQPVKPKICPKCKSPYWDEEYTEAGKKALETKKNKEE